MEVEVEGTVKTRHQMAAGEAASDTPHIVAETAAEGRSVVAAAGRTAKAVAGAVVGRKDAAAVAVEAAEEGAREEATACWC